MKKILMVFICIILSVATLFGCTTDDKATERTLADVAKLQLKYHTVIVECGNEAGTGIIVDGDEESVTIATCYHVVDGNYPETVIFSNGKSYTGESVNFYAYDSLFDVAFLKVYGADAEWDLELNEPKTALVGESAYLLGNAEDKGLALFDGVVSVSEELITTGVNGKKPVIRVTTPINLGSSGAPVFDKSGKLYGMAQSRSTEINGNQVFGFNYVLPTDLLIALYESSKNAGTDKQISYASVVLNQNSVIVNGTEIAIEKVTDLTVNGRAVKSYSDMLVEIISSENKITFGKGENVVVVNL